MSVLKSKHRQSNNAFPVFNEGLEPVASPGLEIFANVQLLALLVQQLETQAMKSSCCCRPWETCQRGRYCLSG